MKNKNVLKLYNLPKVHFVKNVQISNQRPIRIQFDEAGVCSACNFAEFKKNKIDWEAREEQLQNY